MATTTKKKQPQKLKHVPLRTCVCCHESKPKRELLRVVRTPEGRVALDPTGKKSGRGAYLCARLSCWEQAMKKKRLEHEFEITISEEDRAALDAFIATLPQEAQAPVPAPTPGAESTRRGEQVQSSRKR